MLVNVEVSLHCNNFSESVAFITKSRKLLQSGRLADHYLVTTNAPLDKMSN